jgi:predicted metalloendopeptidase
MSSTIHDYLMWTWFHVRMLRDLPEPFAMVVFKYLKLLQNQNSPLLRWHSCVKNTNRELPWSVSRMYVLEHFNNDAKHKVRRGLWVHEEKES